MRSKNVASPQRATRAAPSASVGGPESGFDVQTTRITTTPSLARQLHELQPVPRHHRRQRRDLTNQHGGETEAERSPLSPGLHVGDQGSTFLGRPSAFHSVSQFESNLQRPGVGGGQLTFGHQRPLPPTSCGSVRGKHSARHQ